MAKKEINENMTEKNSLNGLSEKDITWSTSEDFTQNNVSKEDVNENVAENNLSETLVEKEKIFNNLYGEVDGYSVSWKAKREYADQNVIKDILYGETPFPTFAKILDNPIIKEYVEKAENFYDLGSGTGRVIISAYLLKSFKKLVGIELLEGLSNKSKEILEEFLKVDPKAKEKISFINASFFDEDFSDADLISLDLPSGNKTLKAKIEERIAQITKNGTIVISVIGVISVPGFESLGSVKLPFSWGEATVHFYKVTK